MNCSETFKIYNSIFKIKKSNLEVCIRCLGNLTLLKFKHKKEWKF